MNNTEELINTSVVIKEDTNVIEDIQKWSVIGNMWTLSDNSLAKPLLNGIYNVRYNQKIGIYLEYIKEEFEFPYKIYDNEDDFINRVEKTYNNIDSNLGILLNGVKGTGKTVTGKRVSNRINNPTLVISENYGSEFNTFINSIQSDLTIYIDEYEKVFSKKDDDGDMVDRGDLLTLMDGVVSNGYKRLFILTTNNAYVNENLLQRPGRIRYKKEFKDLDKETILNIINDKLIYPEFKDDIVKFISTLELITVDIVKCVLDEVNIHNQSPEEFKDIFNIEVLDKKYQISVTNIDGYELPVSEVFVESGHFNIGKIPTEDNIGHSIYIDSAYYGKLQKVLINNTIKCTYAISNNSPDYFYDLISKYANNLKNSDILEAFDKSSGTNITINYKAMPVDNYHKAFIASPF